MSARVPGDATPGVHWPRITPEIGGVVKVEAEESSIRFDEAAAKVSFTGAMRLRGPREYDDMKGLLRHALGFNFPTLELDFSGLKFLNSSGLGSRGWRCCTAGAGAPRG